MTRAARILCAAAAAAVFLPALTAVAAPGPPDAPEYWFDQWKVPQLWSLGARGQGIRIAEIDTGVNASIPELAGKILPGIDFGAAGDGRVDRDVDQFGHGTAMASIMVASPGVLNITGLAPDAQVLPIALPLSGTTDASSTDHLSEAIRWAADHGAKVISMSLGGTRDPSADSRACPSDEQDAVFYAMSKGAVLVAASGNRGTSDSAVEEPSVCLGVVSVGAVDSGGTVASFSSRHPYLTLAAPGVAIASLSRVPGIAYSGDGTSQATALASAAVALVWSKYPNLTGRQVVARVLASLDHRAAQRDPAYGYGLLDAFRAVTAAIPAGAPNAVYDAADPFAARSRAIAAQQSPRPPPAATRHPVAAGSFAVGSVSRLLVAQVITGALVALLGLAALVALTLVGRARRRGRELTHAQAIAAVPVPPVVVDADGVAWHEILHPQAPAPQYPAPPAPAPAPPEP